MISQNAVSRAITGANGLIEALMEQPNLGPHTQGFLTKYRGKLSAADTGPVLDRRFADILCGFQSSSLSPHLQNSNPWGIIYKYLGFG